MFGYFYYRSGFLKSSIELFPQHLEVGTEGQRRSCLIKETAVTGHVVESELWFVYPTGLPMLKDDNCDSYLRGILLLAMRKNSNIIVHGSASGKLLANLTELQYIWNRWCPEDYSLVEIIVDDIREDEIQVDGAVFAFSGGLDAQFTAYRHAIGAAGYCTQKNRGAVLVHGFDISITDTKRFLSAAKRATETLDSIGVSLLVVKTNLRVLSGMKNWGHDHGLAIASVLSGLSMYAGTGMISSGDSYELLETPWGSHPMTDPLFSSGSFRVIHDGAGFSRSEKAEGLSEWVVGIKNLRVCFNSDIKGNNCGECEKCVRTRLNFLIAGVPNPECFDGTLTKKHFKNIVLYSDPVRIEWNLIRSDMKRTGKGIEWLSEVEKIIKRRPKAAFLLPQGSKRRVLAKKLLKKA